MAKYRKLPVVIEAFQMTSGAMESPFLWPNWLKEAWDKGIVEPGKLFSGRCRKLLPLHARKQGRARTLR